MKQLTASRATEQIEVRRQWFKSRESADCSRSVNGRPVGGAPRGRSEDFATTEWLDTQWAETRWPATDADT